jgi:hypothetical protein
MDLYIIVVKRYGTPLLDVVHSFRHHDEQEALKKAREIAKKECPGQLFLLYKQVYPN